MESKIIAINITLASQRIGGWWAVPLSADNVRVCTTPNIVLRRLYTHRSRRSTMLPYQDRRDRGSTKHNCAVMFVNMHLILCYRVTRLVVQCKHYVRAWLGLSVRVHGVRSVDRGLPYPSCVERLWFIVSARQQYNFISLLEIIEVCILHVPRKTAWMTISRCSRLYITTVWPT